MTADPDRAGSASYPGSDRVAAWTRQLTVDADLSVDFVSSDDQHATGKLTGSGQHLRFDIDRPDVLIGDLGRSLTGSGRALLADVTGQLAQSGVHAEITGPRGRLLAFDPAGRSRVGALLTGSPHITVAPAAVTAALQSVRPSTWLVTLGAVVLAVVAAARLRSHTTD